MTLIKFFLIFSLSTSAFAKLCLPGMPSIMDEEDLSAIEAIGNVIKKDFKRRDVTNKNYRSLLNIETNFTVPLVGNDQYFGRVYIVNGKPGVLKYRDELIAERRYKEELKDDSFYTAEYKTTDINSSKGLSIVKQAGAEVTLKSSNFSTTTGGRLFVKVKGPGDSPQTLVIDVKITKDSIQNFLIVGGKSIPFDSMKINADKSFLTGTSILAGVKDIVFYKDGIATKVMPQ